MSSIIFIRPTSVLSYEMYVVDQNGNKVGYDVSSGNTITEIPNGTYFTDYSDNTGEEYKELDIRAPESNNYTLYIIGKDTESYVVDMSNSNSLESAVVEGTVLPDQTIKYYVTLSSGSSVIFEDNTSPETQLLISGSTNYVVVGGTTYLTSVCHITEIAPEIQLEIV